MGSTSATSRSLDTRPLLGGFGVEITGVDVRTAERDTLNEVAVALAHHGAIVLGGQQLTPREQVDFTNFFGEPAGNPQLEFTVPDEPKVFVISNKIVNGKPIGDPEAGTAWHTDLNYERRPAAYTCLHALEVPPEGSELVLPIPALRNALPQER